MTAARFLLVRFPQDNDQTQGYRTKRNLGHCCLAAGSNQMGLPTPLFLHLISVQGIVTFSSSSTYYILSLSKLYFFLGYARGQQSSQLLAYK